MIWPNLSLREIFEAKLVHASSWLVNSQYVSSSGLLKESSNSTLKRIWVVTDNVLASLALKYRYSYFAGQLDARLRSEYSQYLYKQNRIEAIVYGKVLSFPFKDVEKVKVKSVGGYDVYTEVIKETVLPDWEEYADLLGYASASYLNAGNVSMAKHYYTKFASMWNGTGFIDKAFLAQNNTFQVFKCAFFVYLTNRLNATATFIGDVKTRIWNAYDNTYGGFYTGYFANGTTTGDMNTETTAWALIAFEPRHEQPIWNQLLIVTVGAVVIVGVIGFLIRRIRHLVS